MAELEPLDLIDFTGGLNYRRTEFNLGDNESPGMMNVEIDPRGGFYTRQGWARVNDEDLVADLAGWDPRIAEISVDEDGDYVVHIANRTGANTGTVIEMGSDGGAIDLGIAVGGSTHLADFAEWGNGTYIACGMANPSIYRDRTLGTPTVELGRLYNDDYTIPTDGNMPRAEHVEPHSGYLFVASVDELEDIDSTGAGVQRSRLRWSHPSRPQDWARQDYIDIEVGGGTITGIVSFRDHLLIFKTDSIWALYGYDQDSFQLIKVSRSIGVPTPSAVTRSETAVYFYSASQRGGIYGYDGESPVDISEQIRGVMEGISQVNFTDVWLGFVGRRLWCSIPFSETGADEQSLFVFDPDVGNGAWVRHDAADGCVVCFVEGSDVEADYPMAFIDACSGTAAAIWLDYLDVGAYDSILKPEAYLSILSDVSGNLLVEADTGDPDTDVYLVESASASVPGSPFETEYRTRWLHAGRPDQRKSWRRPRFVLTEQAQSVAIDVSTHWDYNDTTVDREHTIGVSSSGETAFWRSAGSSDPLPDGFEWGDGALWGGAGDRSSALQRLSGSDPNLGGLGVARAIQLEFRTSALTPGRKWGINALFLKYLLRKYTT